MNNSDTALAAYYGGTPGTLWVRATCPFCPTVEGTPDKKRSFGVRRSDGYYHCFRCAIAGFIQNLDAAAPPLKVDKTEGPQAISPPPEFKLAPADPVSGSIGWWSAPDEIIREILQRRKVTPATWRDAGVGYCVAGRYGRRIVVPITDPDDARVWWGFSARTWNPRAKLKYLYAEGMQRGRMLYNGSALRRVTNTPALIVEGVFDALPYWPDAVACLGKPTKDQLPQLLGARRPLVVVLDGDAWRTGKALSLLLQHKRKQAAYIRLPPKTDPNDLDPTELISLAAERVS